MPDCFTCRYCTPNGECYIGTIENCPIKQTETEKNNNCKEKEIKK